MIKLTCEGHLLLNLKRGDKVRRFVDEGNILEDFRKLGINNSKDYAERLQSIDDEKIRKRELSQILIQLRYIRCDDAAVKSYYDLDGKEYVVDKYMTKKEVASLLCPSVVKPLDELEAKIAAQQNEFIINTRKLILDK